MKSGTTASNLRPIKHRHHLLSSRAVLTTSTCTTNKISKSPTSSAAASNRKISAPTSYHHVSNHPTTPLSPLPRPLSHIDFLTLCIQPHSPHISRTCKAPPPTTTSQTRSSTPKKNKKNRHLVAHTNSIRLPASASAALIREDSSDVQLEKTWNSLRQAQVMPLTKCR